MKEREDDEQKHSDDEPEDGSERTGGRLGSLEQELWEPWKSAAMRSGVSPSFVGGTIHQRQKPKASSHRAPPLPDIGPITNMTTSKYNNGGLASLADPPSLPPPPPLYTVAA